MTNKEIVRILRQTASLLELYGENQFKVRSYNSAVYNLERVEEDLTQLTREQLSELPGVGKSIAGTIQEINETGTSAAFTNLLKQTPAGILELLKVKGIGAKKIKAVWDELGVDTPEALLYAAQSGQLADVPGFGGKTQEKIGQIISYHLSTKDHRHYKQAHLQGLVLEQEIHQCFKDQQLSRSGDFRRQTEVISCLEYIWGTDQITTAEAYLNDHKGLQKDLKRSGPFRWKGHFIDSSIPLDVRFCKPSEFASKLILHTGSLKHINLANKEGKTLRTIIQRPFEEESLAYKELGWPLPPAELREGLFEEKYLRENKVPHMVTVSDLQGILHNHSTYSDGKHSLQEMARQCKSLGYQYFGISDHSQTAVYANGLDEEKILAQHKEIDSLNEELAPFRIFKGIESDILNDGSLDYPEAILRSFDFIVASIHFNLSMDREKATQRLIKAIHNPFTTILGHPTGRQLLKREGYPIDHKAVIDACANKGVIIEINSHPWRLDLEWQWVHYALKQRVMISINPDAHEKAALEDVYYGIAVGRKAGLTAEMTFNALDVEAMAAFLKQRKEQALTKTLV